MICRRNVTDRKNVRALCEGLIRFRCLRKESYPQHHAKRLYFQHTPAAYMANYFRTVTPEFIPF
jgi:hypothetical protein